MDEEKPIARQRTAAKNGDIVLDADTFDKRMKCVACGMIHYNTHGGGTEFILYESNYGMMKIFLS